MSGCCDDWTHVSIMVDRGYDPRHSQTQEHVHRVAARNVADGCNCIFRYLHLVIIPNAQSGCLVELVIPLSAVFSVVAAILLAKVSGREVPRATKVIAVI